MIIKRNSWLYANLAVTVAEANDEVFTTLNNFIAFSIFYFEGFIVVASCVMTFEARDSAAKVVPARFKISTGGRGRGGGGGGGGSRRTTSKQIFRKKQKSFSKSL